MHVFVFKTRLNDILFCSLVGIIKFKTWSTLEIKKAIDSMPILPCQSSLTHWRTESHFVPVLILVATGVINAAKSLLREITKKQSSPIPKHRYANRAHTVYYPRSSGNGVRQRHMFIGWDRPCVTQCNGWNDSVYDLGVIWVRVWSRKA